VWLSARCTGSGDVVPAAAMLLLWEWEWSGFDGGLLLIGVVWNPRCCVSGKV
jgi:hypothetical protein